MAMCIFLRAERKSPWGEGWGEGSKEEYWDEANTGLRGEGVGAGINLGLLYFRGVRGGGEG